MPDNFLRDYLSGKLDNPEPEEPRPKAWTCPATDHKLQCQEIPISERCDDCLLRTR